MCRRLLISLTGMRGSYLEFNILTECWKSEAETLPVFLWDYVGILYNKKILAILGIVLYIKQVTFTDNLITKGILYENF